MAEPSVGRTVLLSLIGAVVTAAVGLAFAFVHQWAGLKPDGERLVQPGPAPDPAPPGGRPAVPPSGRTFKGPYELLSAMRTDLREAKTVAPRRRYLTLAHLHNNRNVSTADLRACRAALLDLAGYLSPEGSAVVWRPLDHEQTVYALDLGALGWDEDTWRQVLKFYPYGLTFRDGTDENWREAEQEVQTLADVRLPYVRGDWFLSAVVRPPLGGPHGALKTPKRPLPPAVQTQAQVYLLRGLTLADAAAELPRNEAARLEEFLKADADRLRRLRLEPLLRPGETVRREVWEARDHATSPFQEVCHGLRLGTPLLFQ
jgi:hypothetical protein